MALTKAIKHAGTSQVTVSISRDKDCEVVRLISRDEASIRELDYGQSR